MRHVLCVLALVRCGAPDIALNMRAEGLALADVAYVDLWLIASSEESCEAILASERPVSLRSTLLPKLVYSGAPEETRLYLDAAPDVTLLAEAYRATDGAGTFAARACQDHVQLIAGAPVTVELTFSAR